MKQLTNDVAEIKSVMHDMLTEFKKLSVKLVEREKADEDLFREFSDPEDYSLAAAAAAAAYSAPAQS